MAMAPLAAGQPQPPPTARRVDGRPFVTPYVRALAAERGIDITGLHPSRGRRRLDVADLQAHAGPTSTTATAVTSVVEVDVTLAVRHSAAGGLPLLVLLMQAAVRALAHPVDLRVVRYSKTGRDSTLVTNAADLSPGGLARALTERAAEGAADVVVVDVSGLDLLNTVLELDDSRVPALSMGVVMPRVAVGADGVIAFRSTVQLALTYDPHLLELPAAARVLSAVRRDLERASQE